MRHFRLSKTGSHFRPAKGWKKEIEEISLGFVIATLLVVSANAAWAGSQTRNMAIAGGASAASNLVYYGKVIFYQQCPPPPVGMAFILCIAAGKTSPYVVVLTDGKPPLAAYLPGASKGIVPFPVPGGYVLGFGVPTGQAFQLLLFWMFGP